MKRLWTIVGVTDVGVSFRWYQRLLGLGAGEPSHDHFGQIRDRDGTVLIALHRWGDHGHPTLATPDAGEPGNGLILFFRVDDFQAALGRVQAEGWRLEQVPHVNPNTGTREFSLRDPDRYWVTISEADVEA